MREKNVAFKRLIFKVKLNVMSVAYTGLCTKYDNKQQQKKKSLKVGK